MNARIEYALWLACTAVLLAAALIMLTAWN